MECSEHRELLRLIMGKRAITNGAKNGVREYIDKEVNIRIQELRVEIGGNVVAIAKGVGYSSKISCREGMIHGRQEIEVGKLELICGKEIKDHKRPVSIISEHEYECSPL